MKLKVHGALNSNDFQILPSFPVITAALLCFGREGEVRYCRATIEIYPQREEGG